MAATIRVTTKHTPLAFLLYMTKITLTTDGQSEQVPWGEQERSVEPGRHEVGISFRYLGRDAGPATATVDVADGETADITYKAPFFMFSAGKIKTENG